MTPKTQRWDWAIGLKLEELNEQHLQAAYKLNWESLCKFDNCRKNCKRILCLACFDRSWVDNDNANSSGYDNLDITKCEQKRSDLKSFVGLKNLGATCYVNCLLQLWFHNPALRKAIYGWERDGNNSPKQDANSYALPIEDKKVDIVEVRDGEDTNQSEPTSIDSTTRASLVEQQPQTQSKLTTKANPMLHLNPKAAIKKQNSISNDNRAKLKSIEDRQSVPARQSQIRETSRARAASNAIAISSNHSPVATTTTMTTTTTTTTTTATTAKTTTTTNCISSIQSNPIEQLQLIFARLQFSNKKSIDPFNFIESLALNAAEQQDAQEFGNLFMEFLEKSFSNQKNSFVSKIIQSQFCGRYSYATICDHCKHSSLSDSKFYELDLSIQNLNTLHDCLNEFFRPVPLDGKYNCSHCQKAQSAHRNIILKSLPPTLNLQLLRFVYDVQRNVRQKLNSHIIFPEVLDMNCYLDDNNNTMKSVSAKTGSTLDLSIRSGLNDFNRYTSSNGNSIASLKALQQQQIHQNKSSIYILSAVLIHRGSSPHSGHYIAHIKDRVTKDWYKFNDDSVERIGPQLQVSTDGENISIVEDKPEIVKIADPSTGKVTRLESRNLKSKTAYMLVYQAIDNEALSYPSDHSEKWSLPDHLQISVAEENSRSDEFFESLQIAKEVDLQIMEVRKTQIKTIYAKLVCRDPLEKFEFINKNWLQNWLTNSSTTAKFPPIDNSNLLCIHGKLDFRKADQYKCVRSEGADLLYKEFGGGPRLGQDSMCKQCVELEVKLIQLKDRMKEDQKFITSQAKFKLDAGYDFDDAYIVGKNSYRDWQALVMAKFKKSYPELSNRKCDNNTESSSGNITNNLKKNGRDSDQEEDIVKKEACIELHAKLVGADDQSDSDSDDEAIERFVFNSDILCEHDQLIHDTSAWRIVPKEVWMVFKHYFDGDPTRPLIERNANTLMCPECKRQEVEQQEIGDIQKQKAIEQKSRLPDLFHNRKRASWCSMLPGDVYYALDRNFFTKWQRFIRNPCHLDRPTEIRNKDKLVCVHGRSLYNYSNSNPVLPECPFVLITQEELEGLKSFYSLDYEIKFTIDPLLADEKLKLYMSTLKTAAGRKPKSSSVSSLDQVTGFTSTGDQIASGQYGETTLFNPQAARGYGDVEMKLIAPDERNRTSGENLDADDQVDLTDIDWSECVVSEPSYCSDCHEMMEQDELKKLLSYESATIYITRVEHHLSPGIGSVASAGNGQIVNGGTNGTNQQATLGQNSSPGLDLVDCDNMQQPTTNGGDDDSQPNKRRKKMDVEDEANEFVPPGGPKTPNAPSPAPASNSMLRRTTRRNRNRQQAYTIKPMQTLLELKKEIFSRCQVLPVDQRLFLNDILLNDNSKTMSDLRIIPNCSLQLEVSFPPLSRSRYLTHRTRKANKRTNPNCLPRLANICVNNQVDKPVSDTIDLIEDEAMSRKSCKFHSLAPYGLLFCLFRSPIGLQIR